MAVRASDLDYPLDEALIASSNPHDLTVELKAAGLIV